MDILMRSSCCSDYLTNYSSEDLRRNIYLALGALITSIVAYAFFKLNLGRQRFTECNNKNCIRCRLKNSNKFQQVTNDFRLSYASCPEKEKLHLKRLNQWLELSGCFEIPFNLNGLSAKPIYSNEFKENAGVHIIENNFEVISKEYKESIQVIPSEYWSRNETPSGSWEVLFIMNQGNIIQENLKFFKETFRIINDCVNLMEDCVFGNVAISVVQPNTKISAHKGPTNCRLRCHLGLEVPENDCCIYVEKFEEKWKKGQCIVFDDSFEHSVENSSEKSRTILMFDIWNPHLNSMEIISLNKIFKSN